MRKKKKKNNNNMVKELCILFVLIILLMLILAVMLYDYIPSNISVSEIREYTSDSTTTSIKQEIAYTNGGDATADGSMSESELVSSLKSYSVEAEDLTVYGQKKLYNSGNSNPFEYGNEEPAATSGDTTGGGTTQSSDTSSASGSNTTNANNTTNAPTSGTESGTFFESSGSK